MGTLLGTESAADNNGPVMPIDYTHPRRHGQAETSAPTSAAPPAPVVTAPAVIDGRINYVHPQRQPAAAPSMASLSSAAILPAPSAPAAAPVITRRSGGNRTPYSPPPQRLPAISAAVW